MIITELLNKIFRNSLNFLFRIGIVTTNSILLELKKRVSKYNYNLPIYDPKYYEKLQISNPLIWNDNISQIRDDIELLYDTTTMLSLEKESTDTLIKYEYYLIKNRIKWIEEHITNKTEQVINIVPDYIDTNYSNTTAKIDIETKAITAKDMLYILQRSKLIATFIPSVITKYFDFHINGNINNLNEYNTTVTEFEVSSFDYDSQKIQIKMNIDQICGGIFISSPDINTDIIVKTNINNSTYQFINEIFIENTNNVKDPVIIFEIKKPTSVSNRSYNFKLRLYSIIPYIKETNGLVSICTTKEIPINGTMFKIDGNITSNVIIQYKTSDATTYTTIEKGYYNSIGTRIENSGTRMIESSLISIPNVITNSFDSIEIIGPYNTSEKIQIGASTYYKTQMDVQYECDIDFANRGYYIINNTRTEITPGINHFYPGSYLLYMSQPLIINGNLPSGVNIYVKNKYIEAPYDINVDSYFKYTYMINGTNLYIPLISFDSLYNIYKATKVGNDYIKNYIDIITYNKTNTNIILRFLLTSNDKIINPYIAIK